MSQSFCICLMHPMDPRGAKLGGIETHVRLILDRHPNDFDIVFVGVDEIGDCEIGEPRRIAMAEREITFLPVARIAADRINLAGKTIAGSTTFRFALGMLRHLGAIRRLLRRRHASADLQRYEFALIPKLLGLKTVQMVHGEGSKEDKMDSLIKTYWAVHRANEWLALHLANRIFCVNANIVKRMERLFPGPARRAEVMSVSVDTTRFSTRDFVLGDGIFKIVFAGRLDEFKDPPLMFRTLAAVHAKLGGLCEFHYIGTSDAARYAEFSAISSFTRLHGYQPADAVAAIVARCHAGILTSYFEGMPCYLLETLAIGRPFAAIRLPQYDPLIVEGLSGSMIERSTPAVECADTLAQCFVALWNAILAGRIDPHAIHALVEPYSVTNQMARLFARHRQLQTRDAAPWWSGSVAAQN